MIKNDLRVAEYCALVTERDFLKAQLAAQKESDSALVQSLLYPLVEGLVAERDAIKAKLDKAMALVELVADRFDLNQTTSPEIRKDQEQQIQEAVATIRSTEETP